MAFPTPFSLLQFIHDETNVREMKTLKHTFKVEERGTYYDEQSAETEKRDLRPAATLLPG